MREEDTVMNFADIEKAYLSGYNHNKDTILPDTARHWGGELSIAKAQAQLSFEAGEQQGRREVAEWVEEHKPWLAINIHSKWNKQRKEWGL